MNRRAFNKQLAWTVIAIPAAKLLSACSSYTNTQGSYDMAAGAITYTSTVVGGHSHDVTIEVALFTYPPAQGITQDTTVAQSHMHAVSLTLAELQEIGAGKTITKDTTVTLGHQHSFMFVNSSGATDGGTGGGGGGGY